MITKHDDLIGTLIHDVAHLLRLDIDRRVKPYNLTRIKWLALGIIHKHPGLTQSELAAKLELGAPAVGRLVDRLVERQFIEKTPDPDDRRAYHLRLTEQAEDVVVDLEDTGEEIRQQMLSDLSDREHRILTDALSRMKDNLKKASAASVLAFPLPFDLMVEAQPAFNLLLAL